MKKMFFIFILIFPILLFSKGNHGKYNSMVDNNSHGHKIIKQKHIPYGLYKRCEKTGKGLPPGWEKKLKRGEVLDKELYICSEPAPPYIIKRFPKCYDCETIIIGDKIVRLIKATKEIIDILELDR